MGTGQKWGTPFRGASCFSEYKCSSGLRAEVNRVGRRWLVCLARYRSFGESLLIWDLLGFVRSLRSANVVPGKHPLKGFAYLSHCPGFQQHGVEAVLGKMG